LFAEDYIPTDQDILMVHIRTEIPQDTRFEIEGIDNQLSDCRGSRTARKKWKGLFEDVQVVIFFAALSGYDSAPWHAPDTVSASLVIVKA
jgi:G-protein alpha subunit